MHAFYIPYTCMGTLSFHDARTFNQNCLNIKKFRVLVFSLNVFLNLFEWDVLLLLKLPCDVNANDELRNTSISAYFFANSIICSSTNPVTCVDVKRCIYALVYVASSCDICAMFFFFCTFWLLVYWWAIVRHFILQDNKLLSSKSLSTPQLSYGKFHIGCFTYH